MNAGALKGLRSTRPSLIREYGERLLGTEGGGGTHVVLKSRAYTGPPHHSTQDPQSNSLGIQLCGVPEAQRSGFGELGPQAHEPSPPA